MHAPLDLAAPPADLAADLAVAPGPVADPPVGMPVAPPEPVVPVAGPELGWYPDPTGRHEVRYWDGGRWTERVADNGVETTETPAADVLEVAAGAVAAEATAGAGTAPDWAPDWYPDPTGRHEVRYFDGTTWTEHVANNGLSALDPIADGAPVGSNAAELAATIVPAVSTAASPHATTVEAAEAAFAAAPTRRHAAEEPEVAEAPAVLPVSKDWASRPNALVGWIVVIGAGILGVGSVGPWAKATAPVVGEVTQNGMSGDGRFMLALAVLLIATGIGLIIGRLGRVVAFSALEPRHARGDRVRGRHGPHLERELRTLAGNRRRDRVGRSRALGMPGRRDRLYRRRDRRRHPPLTVRKPRRRRSER